jgi:hypothetical protein
VDTLYDTLRITVYEGIMPRTEEMMDTVIKTLIYVKTCPLKSRLFAELCEEWGHCISLSCFTVILIGGQEETLQLMFTTCEE